MEHFPTIAIVDDNEAVRASIALLLANADFDSIQFASGDELLAAELGDVACILLDIRMPGIDGIDVLKALRERTEVPPVVILTGHSDVPMAVEAMRLGALDFMTKPCGGGKLLSAIHRALSDRRSADVGVAPDSQAVEVIKGLSHRQRQVLCGVLAGHLNKIIAFKMGLSIRTVETYRSQLLTRLGVRGTAEAVRIALAAGLDYSDYGERTREPTRSKPSAMADAR
jgi:two-component system response regulator FixJ